MQQDSRLIKPEPGIQIFGDYYCRASRPIFHYQFYIESEVDRGTFERISIGNETAVARMGNRFH